MMTPEQRYRCEMLRVAMNSIFEHIRTDTPVLEVEAAVTSKLCAEIALFTFTAEERDEETHAWNDAANMTEGFLKDRNADRTANFIAAYAALPPMRIPND